ncbi:hypothetical protein [Bdellovibrio sp. HCB337]|uniref:hypothetical protein n=1 Tax=Bdellovibrio sp. HCB337 TaxID=3394358 RepID=UPI0039A63218
MKNLILFILLSVGSYANAGAISGGGGKAVVCRDANGEITSAQTLDLYEGRTFYGLDIPESDKLMRPTHIQKALAAIPLSSRGLIEAYTGSVQRNMKITYGVELEPIDDALLIGVPRGCKAEQAANYFNDNQILINGDIWDKMPSIEQAALVLHEAVYATARLSGAKDSQRSRHVVANLFDSATAWIDPMYAAPTDHLKCIAKGTYFLAYKAADGRWILQFQMLGGHQVMSKKTVDVFQSEFNFEEAKKFPIIKGDDKVGTKIELGTSARSDFEDQDIVIMTKKWEPVIDINGRIIKGYQTPRYYMSWTSATYPSTSASAELLNCSLQIP